MELTEFGAFALDYTGADESSEPSDFPTHRHLSLAPPLDAPPFGSPQAEAGLAEPPAQETWGSRSPADDEGSTPSERGAHIAALFELMQNLPVDDPRRAAARDEVVTLHLDLADRVAQRYGRWGELVEDITQVARMGLIKAVDRFEPSRGSDFRAFAVPTIRGEVRRFFRDSCWRIKVPRQLQELHLRVKSATEQLTHDLGETPSPHDLASYLDEPVGLVRESMQATMSWSPVSLDEQSDGAAARLADRLGRLDQRIDLVDDHQSLVILVGKLSERERRILELRFFDDLTQREIGEIIGLSQMHVSRILNATLERLRCELLQD